MAGSGTNAMETLYPAGPADVPANYTRPSASYKRQAWIAVGSLLLFIRAGGRGREADR